jgi:hypothetical protein
MVRPKTLLNHHLGVIVLIGISIIGSDGNVPNSFLEQFDSLRIFMFSEYIRSGANERYVDPILYIEVDVLSI